MAHTLGSAFKAIPVGLKSNYRLNGAPLLHSQLITKNSQFVPLFSSPHIFPEDENCCKLIFVEETPWVNSSVMASEVRPQPMGEGASAGSGRPRPRMRENKRDL